MYLTKKIVAGYLENKCDRKLFLSLFNSGKKGEDKSKIRNRLNIPTPYKIRKRGLYITQMEGRTLEENYYDLLKSIFGSAVLDLRDEKDKSSLGTALKERIANSSCEGLLVLEGAFSEEENFYDFLTAIGVSSDVVRTMPPLRNLRPDIVAVFSNTFFRKLDVSPYEVLPSGQLASISPDDNRKLLFLTDIKSSEEASVSQFAEVALYAWMLSNWLRKNGLDSQYIVIDSIGVWTRQSNINGSSVDSHTIEDAFSCWFLDVSISTFDQYMLPLKNFFCVDLLRVTENIDEWQSLEYHLTPSCDMCDFIGRMDRDISKYNSGQEKIHFPEQFCSHKALEELHTSRVPGLTRGSVRSLVEGGVTNLRQLFDCDKLIFNQHSELKKQRNVLPERARSVDELLPPDFFNCKDFTLSKFTNLGVMFHINYDMSMGQAASFAVQGVGFPWAKKGFDKKLNHHPFEKKVFLVEKESASLELERLKEFLSYIEYMIEFVSSDEFNQDPSFNKNNMSTRPSVQFYCWDSYQLVFMRKILSRHIHILLEQQFSRSLLWLFSPEELLQHPGFFKAKRGAGQKLMSPYICLMKNIITKHGRFPLETTYPLFSVAGCVDEWFNASYRKVSPLYKPQFGDYIPRERILEIWLDQVAKSDIAKAKEDAKNANLSEQDIRNNIFQDYISKYERICGMQVWALSVLRKHIANERKVENIAYAPPIIYESILDIENIKTLPADSQLWILFSLLDDQLNFLDFQQNVSSEIESIESRYGCIVTERELTPEEKVSEGIQSYSNNRFYFVSEDSKNSKLREGDGFLTLLHPDMQGFPFMRPIDVLNISTNDDKVFDKYRLKYKHDLNRPFYDLIKITLVRFSRIKGWIEVSFNFGKSNSIVNGLISDGYLVISQNFAIAQGKPLNRNHIVKACLKAIGYPEGIKSSPVSKNALLRDKPEKEKKGLLPCRAAQVLWLPDKLSKAIDDSLEPGKVDAVLSMVLRYSQRLMPNDSQKSAIADALNKPLSVIWGPPGTGKTDTAVNILGVKLLGAQQSKCSLRVLITGPTKRAVIEIMDRLRPVLSALDQNKFTLITLSGAGSSDYDFIFDEHNEWNHVERKIACHGSGKNIRTSEVIAEKYDSVSDVRDHLLQSRETSEVMVVATHYHMLWPLMTGISVVGHFNEATGAPLCGLFDYVLVDESSQIDVPNSVTILNTLHEHGAITFIGDHLQMLPIQSAPIPRGAENMLSSIQQYLVKTFSLEVCPLLENYRSVKEIVEFGHRIGYPSTLTAKSTIDYLRISPDKIRKCELFKDRLDDELAYKLLGGSYPTISMRYRDGMSGQANPFEAMIALNIIVAYFESLPTNLTDEQFTKDFWETKVGIVTPHKAQRALIVRKLTEVFPEQYHLLIDSAVDTVERFQGGERNLIIVSYGVGDEDIIREEEEFLINLNRTNVSISRAKQKVIVMMSDELAMHLTNDEDLVVHAKAIKRFDHYCQNQTTFKVPWLGKLREINYRYLTGS